MKADNYMELAPLYDIFMENIAYEEWVSYVEEIIAKFCGKVNKVVDLACGTGNSTFPWAWRGYRTWGIDLSEEMLRIAREKANEKNLKIEFSCQDMRRFQLEEPVDLAVCFQEGFNYLLETKDVEEAFNAVYRNLTKKGFFIFDLNYLPRILPQDSEVSYEDNERYSLAWRSRLLDKQIWEIEVKGQIKSSTGGGNAFYEKHRERIYEPEEIWSLLSTQKFTVLGTYQAFTFIPPNHQTPKVVFIAQKI